MDLIKKNILLFLFIMLLLVLISCNARDNKIEITNLKCEYLENPLGIDIIAPRLSWKLIGNSNNIKQKAYRILVSDNKKELEKDIGNFWDTDTVFSNQSTQITYKGSELISRQKVFWKVKVWDQNNSTSAWSDISSWEMGLLNESDWEAKWIGKEDDRKAKVGQKNPAPYFRKVFSLKKKVKDVRVYISGLGYYELYINGKKVGDHVLTPNQTNYDRRQVSSYENGKIANMSTRVLYETYDIIDYLQDGKNVVSVILGNGWYHQNEKSEYLPLYFDTPRFIAQLEIDYSDSQKEIVISDESWKTSNGSILDNNLYHGEIYDARLENDSWNKKGFDDSKWESSKVVRIPEGKLHSQMSPPDRIIGTIEPVAITKLRKGIYRYDFGTMLSGWVKLKVKGERGSEIKLKFFEDSDNSYGQTDTYILKGDGLEEWEPRFSWHAFRYVEVFSSQVPLSLENLEGQIVHTDVETDGKFESSNKLFNRINSDFVKTQLDNMHGGVPTDCPHRERRGYTGDGQIAAQAAIYALDVKSFYTKWLNDIADGQNQKTGYVPNTVPYHSGGGGVAWGSAYIILPWYMYLYYGDVSILGRHYDGMKKYINYLNNRLDENGLIYIDPNDYWDLGEWVPPVPTVIPRELVASAYYYYNLTLMNNIANVLKEEKEADEFLDASGKVKRSFNQKYYNQDKHSYSIGYQGANIFPLAFGLVPDKLDTLVFESLVKNVEVKNKGHFDTGMLATPYLLEVLTKYGRADLAYTIMDRRDYPSYGYNIERGASTLWETWTGNESHSHPMFGSVCAWFYQGLGGINPDQSNPGFKHIIIKPQIVKGLEFVNTSYNSVYGKIKSDWEYKDGTLKFDVTIPPNTTASVYVPGKEMKNVSVNSENISVSNVKNNFVHFEVPSGDYTFVSKNIDALINSPMASILSIPKIMPSDSTLFLSDSVHVNIKLYSDSSDIRYTIDGSEPNEHSKLFVNPFMVNNSTVIKARVFKDGVKPGFISTSRITFTDSSVNGIIYKYYKGDWLKLPNFKKIKPNSKGKIYNFDLKQINNLAEKFAVEYFGNLKIDSEDIYTFYLMSNDGSKLFIDNKLIIDFDGLHGSAIRSGETKLTKEMHKIKIEYFQAGGGKALELFYESNDIEKQIIPATLLFTGK